MHQFILKKADSLFFFPFKICKLLATCRLHLIKKTKKQKTSSSDSAELVVCPLWNNEALHDTSYRLNRNVLVGAESQGKQGYTGWLRHKGHSTSTYPKVWPGSTLICCSSVFKGFLFGRLFSGHELKNISICFQYKLLCLKKQQSWCKCTYLSCPL